MMRYIKRVSRPLAMGLGCLGFLNVLGLGGTTPTTSAQNLNYRTPNAVPASWSRYAQLVQYRLKAWLSADNEVAYRFHVFLENRAVDADAPPDSLVVRVWIAKNGDVQ